MELGINHILALIAAFQAFFLAFFIVSKKKNRNSVNWLLAIILVLFSILILDAFSYSKEVFPHLNFKRLVILFSNIPLAISPLLFLYARALNKQNFKFSKIQLLHFLPFVILTLFFIYYWYPAPKVHIINMDVLYKTVQTGLLLQSLIYFIAIMYSVKGIFRFQKTVQAADNNFRATFFMQLIVAFILLWLIELNCFVIYWIFNKPTFCPYSHILYYTSGFIMFNLLSYFAFSNPDIFSIKKKYLSSKLDVEKKEFYAKKLIEIMDKERPYFDSELSINKLAVMLEMTSRDLSQVINEYFNKSFVDFINGYRIEESKKQLMNFEMNNHRYIADIYYAVGFNSKSVFNTAFKKATGFTPSQYLIQKAEAN